MVLTNSEFYKFSSFITANYGIKLPEQKKTMLESRLCKRLQKLGMTSFKEYADYVFSSNGIRNELTQMVDEVTTNKTDFFRERECMDYMVRTGLPELVKKYGAGLRDNCMVWSAACSSGEEPYTLAMMLNEFGQKCSSFRFSIFASDISIKMLKLAVRAVYSLQKVTPVPIEFKRKYLRMSSDKKEMLVRVVPGLRKQVTFRRINLMDKDFCVNRQMDIIFCRNVIIYFNHATQEDLINRLSCYLRKGGYLIFGKSEVLTNMNVQLDRVAPAVYKKEY